MNISENSKIWIYQSDRPFSTDEEHAIQKLLNAFTSQWQAHGQALAALAEIYHKQFIILSVDQEVAGATGCSIDKSVHLMKEIESHFNLNLFDRFSMTYLDNENIISCKREEFELRIKQGIITPQTLVFNNLIGTRKELKTSWNIPLADSWHAKVFSC